MERKINLKHKILCSTPVRERDYYPKTKELTSVQTIKEQAAVLSIRFSFKPSCILG